MENIVYDITDLPLNPSMSSTSFFINTPKPRELTEKEINSFNLKYHNGKEMNPAFEHTGNVWAAANNGKLPTYRFYTCGTNCLVILKYTPDEDIWEEVEVSEIGTLYSMLWFMCLELQKEPEHNTFPNLEKGTFVISDMLYMATVVSGGNVHKENKQ